MASQAVEIIERLKGLVNAKSDFELSKKLAIPQTTISNWRIGRSQPSVGTILGIATKVGKSIEWIATGQEQMTQAIEEKSLQIHRVQEELGKVPFSALDATEEFLRYIKDAKREERETIRRLLKGLGAGSDVRIHLITQLKLIERLVEAEKGAPPGEAEDTPPRAKAS
jgi:transcriptional regulator with XRE-family HTH domain